MNIKTYRQKKGMTQAELARKMGKSTNTINQWESGVRQPKADLLPQLADNLGCTVDELLRPQAEEKQTPA